MDNPVPPEQDHPDALIQNAAHFALWLQGHLRGFLAPDPPKRSVAPPLPGGAGGDKWRGS